MKVIKGRRTTNTAHHAQKPGRRQKILILFFSGETCTRIPHMMNEAGMIEELHQRGVAAWRIRLGTWIESLPVQKVIVGVILFNAVILGLETDRALMERAGFWLILLDKLCLAVFLMEIGLKLAAFRSLFWRNGWNIFDFIVVAIALIPGSGVWAVLRSLRVLRILRLLTVVPQMRKVVAAFLHSIPGLSGVVAVMAVFFFTAGVLATNLFGPGFPQWFGSLGASLYSLFQIMTLESWSMGIVRPVMEVYPLAWAFFVPFIIIATFTILNLFIGIIVSTMQELSTLPEPGMPRRELATALARIEADIQSLRMEIERETRPGS
jgi:voltage-gated sodium channel